MDSVPAIRPVFLVIFFLEYEIVLARKQNESFWTLNHFEEAEKKKTK